MKVKIKRIDKTLPLPEYETKGAVGFDFYSRTDVNIMPKELAYIPLNVVIETPPGYMLALVPRSSTFKKTGLLMANSYGVVDQDFCGENDELLFQVVNLGDQITTVKKGTRIAQGVFKPVGIVTEWVDVEYMENPDRGGIGSTG